MAFKLYKGAFGTMEIPTETMKAGAGGVTKGLPVILAAGASGVGLALPTQAAGGSAATELIYGIALETAAAGVEFLVQPALPGAVWEADAVADTNATAIGLDNFLTTTTCTITVGASTNVGRKCVIIGVLGTAAQRKYLVRLINTKGIIS